VFHYDFARHLRSDPQSRELFRDMPYFGAAGPHTLQELSRSSAPIPIVRDEVRRHNPPLHKLTWKEPIFARGSMSEASYLRAVGQL
jgi:hypothetical protein